MAEIYIGIVDFARLERFRAAALNLLDDVERDRFKTLRHEKRHGGSRADAFLAGRFMAKTMMARFLSRSEREIRFEIGAGGKPVLSKELEAIPEPPGFSIAHSGGLVLCALARGEVGADIERTRAGRDFAGIAETAFCEGAVPDTLSVEGFYRAWTLKEAWLKAKNGSVWDMKRAPPANAILGGASTPAGGGGFAFSLEPGYAAAVVCAEPGAAFVWVEDYTPAELSPPREPVFY